MFMIVSTVKDDRGNHFVQEDYAQNDTEVGRRLDQLRNLSLEYHGTELVGVTVYEEVHSE